jgi:hypothetical protein
MSTLKHIQKLNGIYTLMNKNYDSLKKMFSNHSSIKQKIILSEEILNQAFMLIVDKTETAEIRREFNKIIETIKKHE